MDPNTTQPQPAAPEAEPTSVMPPAQPVEPVTPPMQPMPQPVYAPLPQQPPLAPAGTASAQAATEDDQKDFVIAFLLSWLLGGIGADRFYLGYTGKGIAKLVTFGGLGIWAVIDTVRLAFGKLKDRDGLPLKGYEKNKKWVRLLAILHIVLVGLIILAILFSLVFSTRNGIQQKARDTERKTDINTLQGALEGYKVQHSEYPTLDQMNSSQFRQENFASLNTEAFKDPKGSSDQLSSSTTFDQYEYAPAPTDCTDQGSDKCVTYTLNSTLESGGNYTRYSQN